MKLPVFFLLFTFWATVTVQNEEAGREAFRPALRGIQGEPEWVSIPAGEYTSGKKDEQRTISYSYQIMKFDVTNAHYVDYLNQAHVSENMVVTQALVKGPFAGDQYWKKGVYQYLFMGREGCQIRYDGHLFIVQSGFENHPVVQVSWFGANAYANFYGLTLPTQEEWEKAARGNTGWDYPWGDAIDGSRANYWRSGDPFDNGPTPVGYYDGATHDGFKTTDSPSPFGLIRYGRKCSQLDP